MRKITKFALQNEVYMKRLTKFLIVAAGLATVLLVSTGCFRQDYLVFEDGEFDGIEFSDYDLIQNAELDMDDMDRN